MFTRHNEQLAHHATSLANELLNKFGARDADESAIGVMGDGTGEECLSSSRWPVQEDALGLGDTERLEELRVFDGQLNHLNESF